MKNALKYYYGIDVENIIKTKNEYKFYKNGIPYSLTTTVRTSQELEELYKLSNQLNSINIWCHSIILNNNREIVTIINNKQYILLRKYIYSNDLITFNDIINFSNLTSYKWEYKSLLRTNWKLLWAQKIDYFEYQLSQIGRKHPNLCRTFDYYIGIVENGIQLHDFFDNDSDKQICISHKRLSYNTTLDDFYNPLNFVIDYKVRDIVEYLKQKTLSSVDLDEQLEFYLKKVLLNDNDRKLFIVRSFFPSFYFDIYEKIIDNVITDDKMEILLEDTIKYENFIKKTYAVLKTYVNCPNIEWLN